MSLSSMRTLGRMELCDITAYLRRKVEPPKDRMPKMPVKIKRKEKTL